MRLLQRILQLYTASHIPFFSAALAYYALFSLMPLLVFLVGVFGFVLQGNAGVKNAFLLRLIELVVLLFPTQPDMAQAVVTILTKGAFPITITSLIVLLWASSNFFAALVYALGVIFGRVVPHLEAYYTFNQISAAYDPHPLRKALRQGLRDLGILRGRFLGLLAPILLGLGLILLALLGLLLSFLLRYLPPELDILRGGLEFVIPILGAFVLFFLTYTFLPRPSPQRFATVLASGLAALVWEGMRLGLPRLLPRTQYELLYGPIAGFMLTLIGFYLTMWILLCGATIAKAVSEE